MAAAQIPTGDGWRPESGTSAWDDLAPPPGLCRRCRHARLKSSGRSVFLRCALSDVDPRFPRYPPLPVRACSGYMPVQGPLDGPVDGRASG